MENKEKRTEVSEFGEFGLIHHLTKNNEIKNFSTIMGVGDDAAILNHNSNDVVVSSDMLIENVHFDLAYTPFKYLGYKAVVVNLSDIYAMNAQPKQITLNIGISNKISVEVMEEFYEGVYEACNKYDVDLVGGDTCSSQLGFIISITAIGEGNENSICRRKGAKVNDLICVSGDLGAAYLGLLFLEREKEVYKTTKQQPTNLAQHQYMIRRFLRPEARKDIIDFFELHSIVPTSMIDVSDGLSSELLHLCKNNDLTCEIHEEKLPFAEESKVLAAEMSIESTTCMMNGGEDYELLFTINQKDYEKIKDLKDISIIGYMTDASKNKTPALISTSGSRHTLTALGWKAF